jgi:hypothetical protein
VKVATGEECGCDLKSWLLLNQSTFSKAPAAYHEDPCALHRQQLPQPDGARLPAALRRTPRAEVYSAGVETHGVNPRAIAVMKEDGIDIAHHTSNNVDEYRDIHFDHVITVCDNAREALPPWFPTMR